MQKPLKIGFIDNKLTLRGTSVNLYDYADFNEQILGNRSYIITRPYGAVSHENGSDLDAYEKFSNRFKMYYYLNREDIIRIVKEKRIDVLFIEKAGSLRDGLVFSEEEACKTIIHSVFNTREPHGTLYTAISETLIREQGTPNVRVLPNVVRIYNTFEDLRSQLSISKDAYVFGSIGVTEEYRVHYLNETICKIALMPEYSEKIYFLFMNIRNFFEEFCHPETQDKKKTPKNLIFLPGMADMKTKRMFINTCDAMLYGRIFGETFGLTCAEFSLAGKPVIASNVEAPCRAHIDILSEGNEIILHENAQEVFKILTGWPSTNTTTLKTNINQQEVGYHKFTPMKVIGETFKQALNDIGFY